MKAALSLLAFLALSGCVGESRYVAMGGCQLAYLDLAPEKRPEKEWKFIVPCMESKGFLLAMNGSACATAIDPGISPYCYEPRGFANSLRYYLGG